MHAWNVCRPPCRILLSACLQLYILYIYIYMYVSDTCLVPLCISPGAAFCCSWTFWEKVLIDRSRSTCCFAAPAQLTVPSALRWALVFEANGEIALARTTPRAWFTWPHANLSVVRAPVSRQLLSGGAIGFSLRRDGSAHRILASIDVSGMAGQALRKLSLRLRLPKSWGNATRVTSGTGNDWTSQLRRDVLTFDCGTRGQRLPSAQALADIRVDFAGAGAGSKAMRAVGAVRAATKLATLKSDDAGAHTGVQRTEARTYSQQPGATPTCQGNPKPSGAGCGPSFTPGWGFARGGGFPSFPPSWKQQQQGVLETYAMGAYFVGNASGMDSPSELQREKGLRYVGIGWQLVSVLPPALSRAASACKMPGLS
jgi:hypothetical protein